MPTGEFDEELKARECWERREEMDAIAAFSNRAEFPQVAGTYVTGLPPAALVSADPATGPQGPAEA